MAVKLSDTPKGMVLIPAGTFEMGSVGVLWATPVHTVHLDAFYMDKYAVTEAQFKAFVNANPQWQKENIEDRFHDGDYLLHWRGNDYPAGMADHPVIRVNWYAAMAYAAWAGKRLPTEAEWEYAARGELAGKKYPWGNMITPADANYDFLPKFRRKLLNANYWPKLCKLFGANHWGITAVGQYEANGYGLYDMAGNVWEWCLDAFDADFYSYSHDSQNPIASRETETLQWLRENFTSITNRYDRVSRGGSWLDMAQNLRVASRFGNPPTYSNFTVSNHRIGFRCVQDVAR